MFQKTFILFLITLTVSLGFPMDLFVHSVAESNNFDDFDNYIPKYDDLPKHSPPYLNYAKNETHVNFDSKIEEIPLFNGTNEDSSTSIIVNGIPTIELIPIENVKNNVNDTKDSLFSDFDEIIPNGISLTEPPSTKPLEMAVTKNSDVDTEAPSTKIPEMTIINNAFNISEVDSPINETTRNPREEVEKDDPEFADKESEEEKSSEEEEEDMNMVTGLLSALLGGFSKPDGSIDLEAIVGLVGSLSTQNDDGTYDFQGLTELLKGFFGGGADAGGSDIGAFTGGLLGAVIKGIASPPGGKGVGILTAKILAGILPALSVQPPEDGKPSKVKPGGLDIGGLLGGFIKTILGASKDINPIKFVISTVTSLSNSKPNQPKGKH